MEDDTIGSRAEKRYSRKASASSIWMKIGISVVSLSVLVFLMVKAMGDDSTYDDLMNEARNYYAVGNNELALQRAENALRITEPKTLDHIRAQQLVDEIRTTMTVSTKQVDDKAAYEYFESNLRPFYDKYIDDKSGKFAGKDYLNDPTTARYFVEYRLKYFLDRFPEAEQSKTVRAWVESLKRRYNEADPFPAPDKFWDHELISSMESRLEHYGVAVRLWTSFIANNPNHKSIAQAQEKLNLERNRASSYARDYIVEIERALGAKSYGTAMGKAIKACNNLAGIPDLVAQVKAVGRRVAEASKAVNLPFEESELKRLEEAGGTSTGP